MNGIIVNDIAHVNGGASKIAIDTAVLLASHGHKVFFFTSVAPVARELSSDKNIEVICLNRQDILHDSNRLRAAVGGIWNKEAAGFFARLLDRLSPADTVIHIHALQKSISTSILPVAKKRGFRILYHLHDYGAACPNLGFFDYPQHCICNRKALSPSCIFHNCDRRSAFHKAWRVLRQFVQRRAGLPRDIDAFLAISPLNRRILQPYLGKARIYDLPNIVDVEKSERVPAEKNRAFLFVGRLSPEKGPELFAEAVKRLGVPAIFAGDGPCKERILEIYPEADMRGWVDRAGLERIWRGARALVFPSLLYEGQGLTVLEALAHGIPPIVPTPCAAQDSVVDGKTGLVFQSGEVESLIEAMRALQNDELCHDMSEKGYTSFWASGWTQEAYYDRLITIYQEVSG